MKNFTKLKYILEYIFNAIPWSFMFRQNLWLTLEKNMHFLVARHFFRVLLSLMRGPQPEKVPEKPVEEETTMIMTRRPPPAVLPTSEAALSENPPGTLALPAPGDESGRDASTDASVNADGNTDSAAATGESESVAAEGGASALLAGSLLADPAEEAAKAAAAAEVHAQQEATMAALEATREASAKPAATGASTARVCLTTRYIIILTRSASIISISFSKWFKWAMRVFHQTHFAIL